MPHHRLPPGSKKFSLWTGTDWQCEFHVLGQVFRAFAASEASVLRKTDAVYRRWLRGQSEAVKAEHMGHLKEAVR